MRKEDRYYMGELVEREFPARALMFGFRSMGYSFSTAVADIIDNSISAKATKVEIFSDPIIDEPYFCVLDNGCGMNEKKLDNAMLPGSDRENVPDSEIELGRFGLGLKAASLSQCKVFTVASKQNNVILAMSFDLNVIEKENKLFLKKLDADEITKLPMIDKLFNQESGTLVIWTDFDRINELAKNFEDSFRTLVSESKKHVELVFHRFYDDVEIFYHGRRIEKRDPFLTSALGRQQTGRVTSINVDGSIVKVTPYTLPFAKNITSTEMALLGNPKSIYDDQGFYLYRNKRLISWGSWMRMGIRSELNKLARIQVDIPSSLDSVWMLDVKKSSAKIPDKIKDYLKIAVEDSVIRSKRTVRNPGVKEATPTHNIWERISERDGNVRYEIDRSNPVIVGIYKTLNEMQKELFEGLLMQLEQSIPKYRIHNDVIDSVNITNDALDIGENELIEQIIKVMSLYSSSEQYAVLDRLLETESYLSIASKKKYIMEKLGI